ncbi:MAG TPA: iron chelate uptake ABC transporter family permease subunit, partial [Phycisphaerae bacterium]|nr:iron chelate uptake ABC transporter family permease subunit [Phycisphaerae bacterium]
MSGSGGGARPYLTFQRLMVTIAALAGATLLVGLACSLFGHVSLTWYVWEYRLFGLGAAAVVGAGLAASGAALQGLLRNPLAEPFILGISSGAGVGVLFGMVVLRVLGLSTPLLALLGAVVTCGVVYGIAQRRRRLDPFVLLLSGVIVNVFNGAVIFSLLLFADKNEILNYVRWSMGELPQWIWAR